MQSDALAFLMGNRFSFDRWLQQGIPFINKDEEAAIMAHQKQRISQGYAPVDIDESGQRLLDAELPGLYAWANNPNHPEPFYNIAVANSYQTRIFHQVVRQKLPEFCTVGHSTFIQVLRQTPQLIESRAQHQAESHRKFCSDLERYVGLRTLFEMIIEFKIPVVGHNVFVDFVNIYSKFMGTLPSSVTQAASIIHQVFPIIIDTKYVGTMNDTNNPHNTQHSGLAELLSNLKSVIYPLAVIHPDFSKYILASEFRHEAGWDACETAKLFLKQAGNFFFLDSSMPDPRQQSLHAPPSSWTADDKYNNYALENYDNNDSDSDREDNYSNKHEDVGDYSDEDSLEEFNHKSQHRLSLPSTSKPPLQFSSPGGSRRITQRKRTRDAARLLHFRPKYNGDTVVAQEIAAVAEDEDDERAVVSYMVKNMPNNTTAAAAAENGEPMEYNSSAADSVDHSWESAVATTAATADDTGAEWGAVEASAFDDPDTMMDADVTNDDAAMDTAMQEDTLAATFRPPRAVLPPFDSHAWDLMLNRLRVWGTRESMLTLA
ncbi:uncharacterized protein V1518DRAFT_126047 [Limtongia smithiae]|uniref:uncharacterized protein n=1 Tax=Limtongia smithiae TaxID=1125753 RepID=UPI0034CEEE2C